MAKKLKVTKKQKDIPVGIKNASDTSLPTSPMPDKVLRALQFNPSSLESEKFPDGVSLSIVSKKGKEINMLVKPEVEHVFISLYENTNLIGSVRLSLETLYSLMKDQL